MLWEGRGLVELWDAPCTSLVVKEVNWEGLALAAGGITKFSFVWMWLHPCDTTTFVDTCIVLAADKNTDLGGSAQFISYFFVSLAVHLSLLFEILSSLEQCRQKKIGLLS